LEEVCAFFKVLECYGIKGMKTAERTFISVCLVLLLVWNQWAFGGVHIWAETGSQVFIFCIAWILVLCQCAKYLFRSVKSPQYEKISLSAFNTPATVFFALLLAWSGLQLIPLPSGVTSILSPQIREVYTHLSSSGITDRLGAIPLTLEKFSTQQTWIEYFSYFLFFLLALYCIRDKQKLQRFSYVLLILALFQVFYGLIQTYSTSQNIWWWENTLYPGWLTGTYLGRNNLAGYLELTIPLCFGLAAAIWPRKQSNGLQKNNGHHKKTSPIIWIRRVFLQRPGLSKALLFLSLGVLLGVGLLLTGSRGGILSFTGGCLVMAVLLMCRRGYRSYGLIITLMCFLIFALGLYIGIEKTAQRFMQVHGLEHRMELTRSVWDMVLDYPETGVGLGNFNDAYSRYAIESYTEKRTIVYAHNDWIQAGAELGFPGLVLAISGYFYVLGSSLLSWFQRRDRYVLCMGAGIIAAYIALGIHSFFDYNLHIPANILTFLICLVLLFRVLQLKKSRKGHRIKIREKNYFPPVVTGRIAAIISIIGATACLLFLSGFIANQYQAQSYCPTRINSTREYKPQPSVQEIKKAIQFSPNNPDYRIELGKAYMNLIQGEDRYMKSIVLPKVIAAFRHCLNRDPANAMGWLYLGEALIHQAWLKDDYKYVKQIANCMQLARKYRPRDFRVAFRAGSGLLWLNFLGEEKINKPTLERTIVAAFRYYLQDRHYHWKKVVDQLKRYQTDPALLRKIIRDKKFNYQLKVFKRFYN